MSRTEDIKGIVSSVRLAHRSGKTIPGSWRLLQLNSLEAMLSGHEAQFTAALNSDLGKSPTEAWLTEISFVIGASKYTRRNLARWMKDRRVSTPALVLPGKSWIHSEPLGTVLIISPWNYPLQLCLAPLLGAIAAGNCAVIKPSELAPATSALLAKLLPRYLDPDCVRVVEGGVAESTALLEQRFDHIIYTGGEQVARIVMSAAAKHLTPVTLELGGKSPCLILPDADLDITARRIAWGKFTNAGQTCIAPDYVLAEGDTHARLVPRLQACITEMFGEDPANSGDYGRMVNARHFDRVRALLNGEQVIVGGQADRDGLYIAPTVLSQVSPDSAVMREEIFGPVLPLVNVESMDQALDFIRARPKPLAAYLFSRSKTAQQKMVRDISAGSVCINDVMMFMAVEQLPFGGTGTSGFGTYKGEQGFRQLSHPKAVLKRGWRPDWKLRYAPFTPQKIRWLRKLR